MPDISKITLPSGTTYDIKDAVARQGVAGGIQFRGVTTTVITDGSTTTSYVIDDVTKTAANGDMVIYGNKEFVYSTEDNKWHELGDTTDLGDLAYKDTASGSYTPTGSVSVSVATTSNQTATVSAAGSGETTYTPAGSVAAPTISVATNGAGATTTIKNPTKVTVAKTVAAAAPGATAPDNAITYYNVTGETLSLYQIGYTTGDSITTSDVTVKTGDATYEATAPAFTGTGVRLVTGNIAVPSTLSGSFSGEAATITVS